MVGKLCSIPSVIPSLTSSATSSSSPDSSFNLSSASCRAASAAALLTSSFSSPFCNSFSYLSCSSLAALSSIFLSSSSFSSRSIVEIFSAFTSSISRPLSKAFNVAPSLYNSSARSRYDSINRLFFSINRSDNGSPFCFNSSFCSFRFRIDSSYPPLVCAISLPLSVLAFSVRLPSTCSINPASYLSPAMREKASLPSMNPPTAVAPTAAILAIINMDAIDIMLPSPAICFNSFLRSFIPSLPSPPVSSLLVTSFPCVYSDNDATLLVVFWLFNASSRSSLVNPSETCSPPSIPLASLNVSKYSLASSDKTSSKLSGGGGNNVKSSSDNGSTSIISPEPPPIGDAGCDPARCSGNSHVTGGNSNWSRVILSLTSSVTDSTSITLSSIAGLGDTSSALNSESRISTSNVSGPFLSFFLNLSFILPHTLPALSQTKSVIPSKSSSSPSPAKLTSIPVISYNRWSSHPPLRPPLPLLKPRSLSLSFSSRSDASDGISGGSVASLSRSLSRSLSVKIPFTSSRISPSVNNLSFNKLVCSSSLSDILLIVFKRISNQLTSKSSKNAVGSRLTSAQLLLSDSSLSLAKLPRSISVKNKGDSIKLLTPCSGLLTVPIASTLSSVPCISPRPIS